MEIPLSNHLLHPCSSTVLRLLSAILLPEMSNVFVSDLLSELQMNGFAMYPIKMGFFDRTLCVQIPQVSVFPKIILTGTPSMRQLLVMSPNAASQQAMAFLAERPIAVKRQRESQIVAEQLGDASLSDELEVLRVGEQTAKRSEEKGSNGRGLAKGEQLVEDLEVGVVARGENGGLQSAADFENAIGEGELGSAEHGGDEERESRGDGDGLCENDVFVARFHGWGGVRTSWSTPTPARKQQRRCCDA